MGRRRTTAQQSAFGASLGRAIRDERLAQSLSGEDLARASQVSVDLVRSIESGRVANPGLYSVAAIASALQLSIDDLTPRVVADRVAGV